MPGAQIVKAHILVVVLLEESATVRNTRENQGKDLVQSVKDRCSVFVVNPSKGNVMIPPLVQQSLASSAILSVIMMATRARPRSTEYGRLSPSRKTDAVILEKQQ